MTTAVQLIGKLGAAGIRLWLDDEGQLRFRAPKGAMTEALKAELVANKQALISFLQQTTAGRQTAIEPLSRDHHNDFPLSYAQQRFWFLDRLLPGNPSLHIPAVLAIRGRLDIGHLQQALEQLCQRQEMLRSIFVSDAGKQPRLHILPAMPWQLQEDYDLSHLDEASRHRQLEEIIAHEALRPFTLQGDPQHPQPLLRMHIVRLSAGQAETPEYRLLITLHHIIADGWSVTLLVRELVELYHAISEQRQPQLPALDIQYADYAVWQQAQADNDGMARQLDYWRQQLAGVPVLDLPLDHARPRQSSARGGNVRMALDGIHAATVHKLADALNTSAFAVLLATFHVLMYRYSGQQDICIGTPVAGRNNRALENIIGCFINLLAIRSTVDSQRSFADHVRQLSNTLLAAQENSDVPFEQVAEHCSEQRSLSHTPLFQVLFTHQQDLAKHIHLPGLQLELLPQSSQAAKYDLQLHIDESDGRLAIDIEYNSDIFNHDTVTAIARHYGVLLKNALGKADSALCTLDIFDAGDRALLAPATVIRKPALRLFDMLDNAARQHRDRIAIYHGEHSISHGDLHQHANRLANQLASFITPGERVGLCLSPGIGQMTALLAIIRCGACYVPMDPAYPDDRLQHMASNAGMCAIISDASQLARLQYGITVIDIDNIVVSDNASPPLPDVDEDRLLYLIYTSGSTGLPKGAGVSAANEVNLLQWYWHHYRINADDRILVFSALGFDLTQKNLLTPLVSGAAIVFADSPAYDPDTLIKTVRQHRVSHINCAPSAFYPLVETARRQQNLHYLASLRHVLFGGEPIIIDNLLDWTDSPHCQALIHNMYGPTECTDITCAYSLVEPRNYIGKNIPVGQPIDGVYTYLLDDDRNLVPAGVAGELFIGGNSVGSGYFGRPDLTAASFVDNPFGDGKLYRTRDRARYRKDLPGMPLEFLSRVDDQVKIRGFRVELGEISARLMACDGVREAIIVHDSEAARQRLVAYYIAADNTTLTPLLLREQLKKQLPDYMIPAAFVPVSGWPLSANGKIDKKRLPAPSAEHSVHATHTAPATLLEQQLCELWQQVLEQDPIGTGDNFFELGGHSLTATRLIAAVSENFAIDMPLPLFFANPTIAAMAQFIEQGNSLQQLQQQAVIEKADRSQALPLSHAQQRLWIIEQLNPGTAAYNIPLALQIDGQLDKQAFVHAILQIVQRHESLRTTIAVDSNGNACQHILPAESITVLQADLSASANALAEAQQRFADTANTPFDINGQPLVRLQLLDLGKHRHVFIVCLHHIIADGWSLTILQRELAALYPAGRTDRLPELAFQYADFSVWQRCQLQQEQQQHQLDYWLQQLDGIPSCLTLPTDRPRPARQTFNGDMFSCHLPQELSLALAAFSRQHGITLYTLLLSFYALLLGKYARQDDICIGTPVSGRDNPALQPLIGYFVNAVVIRCQLSGNPDVMELLRRLQKTALAAFAHQDIPVENVLEALPIERNLSYPPVAQAAFSLINDELARPLQLDDLCITLMDYPRVVAKYDLTLIVIEQAGGLQLNFEYNSDLFDRSTIAGMAGHFSHLLRESLADTGQGIEAISLLDDSELADAVGLDAAQVETILPLTTLQREMTLAQWLLPDSLANTLGYRAEVDFVVDADLWRQAIQQVCDQQPVTRTLLRANTRAYGDIAYQCVMRQLDIELEVMDYRDQCLDNSAIDRRVDDFIYRPAAYRQGIFIRYGLMRLAGDRTVLLLSSHHALLDGVAIVLIAQQTARHYEALCRAENQPDPLPVADTARLVAEDLRHTNNSEALAFWRRRLASCEAPDFPLALCSDPPRQIVKRLPLTPQLTRQIKQYCRRQRMTPAQLIKLLYCFLIANYCRTDEFYISEFNAGRNRDNATSLGCYFTQTPFVFSASLLHKGSRIEDWFDYLRQYRKEIKPFDAISTGQLRKLAAQGRLHFMYNYYHFFPQQQTMMGHAITCIETPPFIEQTVQFVAKEHEQHISLELYYPSHVFNDLGMLQRLADLCRQLTDGISDIADLSLVDASERQQLLQQWNGPVDDSGGTGHVQSLFEAQAARSPDAIAIRDDHGQLSYRQLNEQANRLARWLHGNGIGTDVCVGICLPRSIHAVTAILATIKAGGAYVPIDASYPRQRIDHMLAEAQIHVLITDSDSKALFGHYQGLLLCIDEAEPLLQAEATGNLPVTGDDNDLLYVIFTSGSTGLPKGAGITHRGEINLLRWYVEELAFTPQSRTLIISALGFDLTQKNLFAPLVSGGQLILSRLDYFDIDHIRQLISSQQITHINCAPSAFYPLLENADHWPQLDSLQQLVFGGEPINSAKLLPWLTKAGSRLRLSNNYGPTECTDIALYFPVDNIRHYTDRPIPAGKPNDNVNVFILNPMAQLLPAGLVGEIAIAGNGVGRGYLNNDERNQLRFISNPFGNGRLYLSGDLGFYDHDGNVVFVARSDHQVKINGLRIELAEIEQALLAATPATEALVTANDNRLVAYLLTDVSLTAGEYRQRLADRLPAYMIPAAYVTLAKWPLGANGKIDRNALPQPADQASPIDYVAPRDEVEEQICHIVANVLGTARVGIYDNFFDIGGHSLAASRAIVQIRERFAMDIPLNVLFEMTSVEKLAAYIKAAQWAQQSESARPDADENRDTGFI